MARYIEADKIIQGLKDAVTRINPRREIKNIINIVIEILENASTADAAEVVRCKDCMHYKEKCLNEFDVPVGVCSKDVEFWDDEPREVCSVDFCSDGERR